MTTDDHAGEARKGLIDSVKGKAKEVAGALTGNDSLTAEGQLEQTQAKERKDASTAEALADAEAEQARVAAREAGIEGAQQRAAVETQTAAVEQSAAQERAAKEQAAAEAARRDVLHANEQAEAVRKRDATSAKVEERADVEAASENYVEAVSEFEESAEDAAAKRAEADRLRARALSEEGN